MDDNDGKKVYTRWEWDYTLSSTDKLDLLDEYLEMGESLMSSDGCICTVAIII